MSRDDDEEWSEDVSALPSFVGRRIAEIQWLFPESGGDADVVRLVFEDGSEFTVWANDIGAGLRHIKR